MIYRFKKILVKTTFNCHLKMSKKVLYKFPILKRVKLKNENYREIIIDNEIWTLDSEREFNFACLREKK